MGAKLAMPAFVHACTYPCQSSTVTPSVRGAKYPEWSCLATSGTHMAGQKKHPEDAHSTDDIKNVY